MTILQAQNILREALEKGIWTPEFLVEKQQAELREYSIISQQSRDEVDILLASWLEERIKDSKNSLFWDNGYEYILCDEVVIKAHNTNAIMTNGNRQGRFECFEICLPNLREVLGK